MKDNITAGMMNGGEKKITVRTDTRNADIAALVVCRELANESSIVPMSLLKRLRMRPVKVHCEHK